MEKNKSDAFSAGEIVSSDTVLADSTLSPSAYPLSASSIPVTGEARGRYVLVDAKTGKATAGAAGAQLARGGMGRILCAFDSHTGREVVIKERLLDGAEPAGPQTDEAARTSPADARFIYEARITARLEHPNIVPVHEVGRKEDGRLYYTMRRVRGRTLDSALTDCESLAERMEQLPHFLNLCNAIAYAHSKGVIHRDIKPQNVMVSTFGETVVLDWGLAKIVGSPRDERDQSMKERLSLLKGGDAGTVAGYALGTPSYMSPEQAEGDIEKMDFRSDVYSLGCVLYEILTGRPPFKKGSFFETVAEVLHGQAVPIGRIEKKVPGELAEIAHAAMSKDRDLRFLNAGEMARKVQEYLSGKFVPPPSGGAGAWLAYIWRQKRRPLLIAVSLILLFAAGLVFHGWRTGELERSLAMAGKKAAEAQARLDEEKKLSTRLGAQLISREADLHGGTAAGLALAAAAVARDDAPDLRVKFYLEAVARAYGMAEKGFWLEKPCALARAPSGGEAVSVLPCIAPYQPVLAATAMPQAPAARRPSYYYRIDPGSEELPAPVPLPWSVSAAAVSPSGSYILAEEGGTLHVFDREGKESAAVKLGEGPKLVGALVLSASGGAAAATAGGEIFFVKGGPPRALAKGGLMGAVKLVFLSEKDECYALDAAGAVIYYASPGAKPAAGGRICPQGSAVIAAAARPAGEGRVTVAAACGGAALEVGSLAQGVYTMESRISIPPSTVITALDLSFDGAAAAWGTEDGEIGQLRVEKGKPAFAGQAAGHTGRITGLSFTGSGMISSGGDGFLKLWPLTQIQKLGPGVIPPTLVAGRVLDVDPGGKVLMESGGCLAVHDLQLGREESRTCLKPFRAARLIGGGKGWVVIGEDGALTRLPAGFSWPSPVPGADGLWMLDRAGGHVMAVGAPSGELGISDYMSGKTIGAGRTWLEGEISLVVVDPFNVNIAVLYRNGAVAVGGMTAEKPLWKGMNFDIRQVAATGDGQLLVMADGEGRLWAVDLAGKGNSIKPCEVSGAAEPLVSGSAPASCFAPPGSGGVKAIVPLGREKLLIAGTEGFVIYDIFLGKAMMKVSLSSVFEEMLADPYGRNLLLAAPREGGATQVSLLPVGGWLIDPPRKWMSQIMRATGYKVEADALVPLSPAEWP